MPPEDQIQSGLNLLADDQNVRLEALWHFYNQGIQLGSFAINPANMELFASYQGMCELAATELFCQIGSSSLEALLLYLSEDLDRCAGIEIVAEMITRLGSPVTALLVEFFRNNWRTWLPIIKVYQKRGQLSTVVEQMDALAILTTALYTGGPQQNRAACSAFSYLNLKPASDADYDRIEHIRERWRQEDAANRR